MLAASRCSGHAGDLEVLQRSLNHGTNLRVLRLLSGTTDLLQSALRHTGFLRSLGGWDLGRAALFVTLNSELTKETHLLGWGFYPSAPSHTVVSSLVHC